MLQEYTSAKTCIKQIPAGFKIVDKYFGWKPYTNNLDIGGGKFDLMTIALAEKGVCNLIYDPYNRTKEHNENILSICNDVIIDTVTIFNVLNVIKEYEIQIEALKLAYDALKSGGMVFIRSMYKNPSGKSGVTKSGTFQHYKTQEEYLEIIKTIFPDSQLKYGIIFATK